MHARQTQDAASCSIFTLLMRHVRSREEAQTHAHPSFWWPSLPFALSARHCLGTKGEILYMLALDLHFEAICHHLHLGSPPPFSYGLFPPHLLPFPKQARHFPPPSIPLHSFPFPLETSLLRNFPPSHQKLPPADSKMAPCDPAF